MRAYLVGIKGTGMAHLARLLVAMGYTVSGCDTAERFATDAVLAAAAISVDIGFSASLLPPDCSLLIYSSAYKSDLPIIAAAAEQGVPCVSYPAFVASLSERQRSWAVAGTHGKSSSCAIATHLLASESAGTFPFYSLYGSSLVGRDETPYWGSEHALFEACEYRDHFLSYTLYGVLITSVDYDHVDYFSSPEAVAESFKALVDRIVPAGVLIYNSDDSGAAALGSYAQANRPDLKIIRYGESIAGTYQLTRTASGSYSLNGVPGSLHLGVDTPALVGNYLGALLLANEMQGGNTQQLATLSAHLESFPGLVGRLELIDQVGQVLCYDDYAHHPKEIAVTLTEVALRHSEHQRLVLFSPHTASRTSAFLQGFVEALQEADHVIIQPTYASARGDGVTRAKDPAYQLYRKLSERLGRRVSWAAEEQQAVAEAVKRLQEQSVCITMGAGNNRGLAEAIALSMRSHR
ncbi:MAG TPA: Mur ligase domain-containing protein [Sphaerochaeta sp.]|nr:Mur ligase domain-containing protein [Sphaerochaeta sp.]